MPVRRRPPMSTGELIAWQAGVDWGRAGHDTASVLAAASVTLAGIFGPELADCRDQLGPDVFGFWFRTGLEDQRSPRAR